MAEVLAAVLDEHVPFLEAALVEQQLDAFPGRQLAFGVLGLDPTLTASLAGRLAHLLEPAKNLLHRYSWCVPT